MTGRCHRRKKMMGRGAEGGCGTEEKPCRISRVPTDIPAKLPAILEKEELPPAAAGVDLFSQALKALCERSPFDAEEANSVSSVTTLPSGLGSLLSKHSERRKKHKKSHPDGDANSSKPGRRSSIWVETEDCFRELTFPDIENLLEVSTFRSLAARKCFSIPLLGNASVANRQCNDATDVVGWDNGVVVKEDENKGDDEQLMKIDNVGTVEMPQEEEKSCSPSQCLESSSGLEWILGSRNRILLTSERPSKKQKLLGSDAGLEKLLVSCPYEENSSLCHFCCRGNKEGRLNRLIACSSCKVVVHRKCYGVQDDVVVESWLCAWCKHREIIGSEENVVSGTERPCVFCPKQGGALKVVHKSAVESANRRSVEFAHLFCSLWMPEVYVENTAIMEPIMNVDGIKETRKKLICNICKVKYGACVRCSNGACRTSFHPICAREASHRLEVWGMLGRDNIELRAFCSKHSGGQNTSCTQYVGQLPETDANNSCITSQLPVTLLANKPHMLKIGRKNGDKLSVHLETPITKSATPGDCELHCLGKSDGGSKDSLKSENGDVNHFIDMDNAERTSSEDITQSKSQKFSRVLKKLIDRGKFNVKDLALEIDMSPDSLAATLADDHLVPELQCKIVKWLKNHSCVGSLKKNLKLKIKSKSLSEAEIEEAEDSDAVAVSESDNKDQFSVKSVPPRRRTKSNIRVLKDEKLTCSPIELCNENGMMVDEVKIGQHISEPPDGSVEEFLPDATEKMVEHVESGDCLVRHSPKFEGNSAKPSNCSLTDLHQAEVAGVSEHNFLDCDWKNPDSSFVDPVIPSLMNVEGVSGSYIHPSITKKWMQIQSGVLSEDTYFDFDGPKNKENFPIETSSSSIVGCDHQNQHQNFPDMIYKHDGMDLEQLIKARNMGIPELSPKDEVEGELIYFQHRLLRTAVTGKRLSDDLICKVVKSLPMEIDNVRSQRWDSVLVNQYLYELREAKKQGRKERRHREAQAVLAAANAAAASSSRISSFRKDGLDESAHQENLLKVNPSSGRAAIYSQLMPRPKETISRVAASRVSSETHSDVFQSTSDISKEHPRSCDICRRSETILNAILVCSSCKVAVHLDCYRSVKDSTGPWHCELCEELLSSSGSRAPAVNSWEKPFFFAECGICGGTTGAFRKSTDDQWIHAFCAEWVFESKFRRGQVNPIEGMETVSKGGDFCCVCHHKKGICIKCNYGHCQSTFHPSCARSAGFFMNIRAGGGKLQHKAYCEKHSLEQRNKTETKKHGIEELKSVKQIRVELERLRLLCERIIKREKLKRELVLCSHDILASRRDSVALSALVRNPFFPPDVSSESATTSLKGHTDGYKSCSEAFQRSDDITVDSTVSVKHYAKPSASMDNDQRTDDSLTSHQILPRKPVEKKPFSGKKIPHRASSVASRYLSDDGDIKAKSRKHTETFEKELVMTSDQASMKNQRLPKGFVYVPIGCLSNDEQTKEGDRSCDQSDRDG